MIARSYCDETLPKPIGRTVVCFYQIYKISGSLSIYEVCLSLILEKTIFPPDINYCFLIALIQSCLYVQNLNRDNLEVTCCVSGLLKVRSAFPEWITNYSYQSIPWGRRDMLGAMDGKQGRVYVEYVSVIVSCCWIKSLVPFTANSTTTH